MNILQDLLDEISSGAFTRPDVAKLNRATHAKLDSAQPAHNPDVWKPTALVLHTTHQTCRCGHQSLHTDGLFIQFLHRTSGATRLSRAIPGSLSLDLPRATSTTDSHITVCSSCFSHQLNQLPLL
jgi:hypothetical protein